MVQTLKWDDLFLCFHYLLFFLFQPPTAMLPETSTLVQRGTGDTDIVVQHEWIIKQQAHFKELCDAGIADLDNIFQESVNWITDYLETAKQQM
jgi:hypothetical protein